MRPSRGPENSRRSALTICSICTWLLAYSLGCVTSLYSQPICSLVLSKRLRGIRLRILVNVAVNPSSFVEENVDIKIFRSVNQGVRSRFRGSYHIFGWRHEEDDCARRAKGWRASRLLISSQRVPTFKEVGNECG